MRYCPRCGSEVEEDSIYCEFCGMRLEGTPIIRKPPLHPPETTLESIIEAFRSLFMPTPHIRHPSPAVYETLPRYTPIKKYLIIGVILTVIGLTLTTFGIWIKFLGFTIVAFTSPAILLIWMYYNDRFEREPLSLIALTFGWGVISTFPALIVNTLMRWPPPFAALVEEPLKILGVYWLAKHKTLGKEFNDHLDGMVYGAAAGAGFAGTENILYIVRFAPKIGALTIIILRSITPISHMVFTAIAGRSLGIAKVRKGKINAKDLIPGLAAAITLHFLWNISSIISITILLPAYIMILTKLVREAQRDEILWGLAARTL